ncbi:MAG TPA: hypothetical protein PLV42_10925 [bacterium]|nr:hypothetical protein [bacterium]
MAYRTALTALAVLLLLSCEKEKWPAAEHPEEEPNGDPQSATYLTEGITFEGTIDDRRPGGEDVDYYRLRGHAGFIYRVEFETLDPSFKARVSATDDYGAVKQMVFSHDTEKAGEFFEVFEGTLFFSVGDALADGAMAPLIPSEWRDGRYWLRVTKRWACDQPPVGTLAVGVPLTVDMGPPSGGPQLLKLETAQGHYGIAVAPTTAEKRSFVFDKKMVLFDCLTGSVVAGSDDLDHESGLNDPYLYEYLGGARDDRLVVERWVDDLSWTHSDMVTVTLTRHDPAQEREPNDRFMYANVFDPAGTTGTLDAAQKMIEGVMQSDRDVFKREVIRDAVVRFAVAFEKTGSVAVELWSSSVDAGGYTMVPLMTTTLTGAAGDTRPLTVFLPFTGILYMSLQGTDVPYSFSQTADEEPVALGSLGTHEERSTACETLFFTWDFPAGPAWALPSAVNAVRISARSDTAGVSLQVFDERHLPMLVFGETGPVEEQSFYLTRLSDQDSLILGVTPEKCDGTVGALVTMSVEEAPFIIEEPDFTKSETVIDAIPGTTYIGWFDTDILLVENRWRFTPERDGTLFLMTTPMNERNKTGVDTVIRLYEEGNGEPIAMNDDMIESLPFQNYSFVRATLNKGVAYTISVKPFMDDSSNIPAMNIHANFGLDIRFEE